MEGPANTKKFPQGDNILRREEDYHENHSRREWSLTVHNVLSDPERRVRKLVSTYCGVVVFRGVIVNHEAGQHRYSPRDLVR